MNVRRQITDSRRVAQAMPFVDFVHLDPLDFLSTHVMYVACSCEM